MLGSSASAPLVAHFAAAGDISSPGALQLFGLLSSVLKACSSGSSPAVAAARMQAVGAASKGRQPVITVVGAAVCSMLSVALDKDLSAGQPESSSSTSEEGRDAYTAVLPWLVLLGRFCSACALLMQDWQGSRESSGASSSYQHPQRTVQESAAIVDSLLLLQDSMAGVVQ